MQSNLQQKPIMVDKTYAITGIPIVGGKIPTRQEITVWYENKENKYQVSLFMQAMTKFKEIPFEKRESYFQIAGIHSYPLVGWDSDKPLTKEERNPKNPEPGYCHHNMVTFPTWHRPYMLLYEQALHDNMICLIKEWKEGKKFTNEKEEEVWRSAADQFRLPYWDWARKQTYKGNFAIPQVCTRDTVSIILPGGKTDPEYSNPLVGFRNRCGKPMGDKKFMGDNAIKDNTPKEGPVLPWSRCIGTSRYGITTDEKESTWIQGVNDWEQANQAMADPLWYNQDGGSFGEAVSRLLSPNYFDCWESFASTAHNDPKTARHFLSLEYIHNVIHNCAGGMYRWLEKTDNNSQGYKGIGLGHMSDVPVAAFDPIFWFHHCNIDRLMAIWQTLNDEKWFDNPQEYDPKPSSDLRPFHYDEDAHMWTSDRCKSWTTLNYQYDDLVPQADAINPDGTRNEEKYLADLRVHIDKLYPPTNQKLRNVPGYILEDKFDDYVINVIYDRYALNGYSYAILFFLGEAPQELSSYREDKNFVGLVYTFSAPTSDCANCAKQQADKVLSKAQIPLTLQLLAKLSEQLPPTPGIPSAGVGNVDRDMIAAILKKLLNWKFVQLGGEERPATDFPNTEIAVLRGQGSLPNSNEAGFVRGDRPLFSGYRRLDMATEDNIAGFAHPGTSLSLIHDDPEE